MLNLQQAKKIGIPVEEKGFWGLKSDSYDLKFLTEEGENSIPVNPGDIIVNDPPFGFEEPEGYEIKGEIFKAGSWFANSLVLTPTV